MKTRHGFDGDDDPVFRPVGRGHNRLQFVGVIRVMPNLFGPKFGGVLGACRPFIGRRSGRVVAQEPMNGGEFVVFRFGVDHFVVGVHFTDSLDDVGLGTLGVRRGELGIK